MPKHGIGYGLTFIVAETKQTDVAWDKLAIHARAVKWRAHRQNPRCGERFSGEELRIQLGRKLNSSKPWQAV
jgi:hypothetical protein